MKPTQLWSDGIEVNGRKTHPPTKWKQDNDALVIEKPLRMPCEYVLVFKIAFTK